jgi:putative RNA 2'-phosphotransferase
VLPPSASHSGSTPAHSGCRVTTGTSPLWHGTNTAALEGIAGNGLLPGRRSHVHLAPAAESRIGKRSSVDFLLEISPARLASAGLTVFRAPNGVVLVRHVPTGAIAEIHPTSAGGRARMDEVRGLFEQGVG